MQVALILCKTFLGNSLENNGNSNPTCTTFSVYVGGIRSFYCQMFARYVNLYRMIKKNIGIDVADIFVNPETTGEWNSFLAAPRRLFQRCIVLQTLNQRRSKSLPRWINVDSITPRLFRHRESKVYLICFLHDKKQLNYTERWLAKRCCALCNAITCNS